MRTASCASWCSTAALATNAPVRWCSDCSNWRPIARSLCSVCRRRRNWRRPSTGSSGGWPSLPTNCDSESSLANNNRLLDELTALAAELEAGAAGSLFRFGASRAYDEIVQTRLRIIGERKVGGLPTWSSFLARRMAPAIRTCIATEERQANLSRKLARAAQLLRTRVDVEVEQQNRDLLRSMNARTRLQLRLQATVEGLSVAAISYYVVGLFGYLVKGAHDAGWPVDPSSRWPGLYRSPCC